VAETPPGKINTTDPDSRLMKVTGGYVQGYNAQAAVNEGQIVLAAEISVDSPDFGHLEPMVDVTVAGLKRAGIADKPKVAVADAGYWHHDQMDNLAAAGIQVLIPPDSGKRKRKGTPRRGWQGGRYAWMRRGARHRTRRAPLPKTLTDGRADVRTHQAQPGDGSLPPTR
jgi:hypothetical protein